MSPLQITLIGVLLIIVIGVGIHIYNIRRIHKKITDLRGGENVTAHILYRYLFVPQGSNFNVLAITSWASLITAVAYLYFFTPAIFPSHNYFSAAPWIATGPVGFGAFGIIVAGIIFLGVLASDKLPESCRCYRIAEIYGYYNIDKGIKRAVVFTIPSLWLSISISSYLGTIYPAESQFLWLISFALMTIPLVILLTPIFKDFMEGR